MESRGITLAFDSSFADIACLLKDLAGHKGVTGIKIGAYPALQYGLANAVKQIKQVDDHWYLMYDHQKAGTDIPDISTSFAKLMYDSGVNAAIVYPLSGPGTQKEMILQLSESGIAPLVGGAMTHEQFFTHEGGYIGSYSPVNMYSCSVSNGVRSFVVPGNRPDLVESLMDLIIPHTRPDPITVFAPGIHSLCDLEKLCKVLRLYPVHFSPIIGRLITEASNPVGVVDDITQVLED